MTHIFREIICEFPLASRDSEQSSVCELMFRCLDVGSEFTETLPCQAQALGHQVERGPHRPCSGETLAFLCVCLRVSFNFF